MGPPHDLVLGLRDELGIQCFVETGTFHGGTTKWAAQHFPHVFTIEASSERYNATRETLAALPNVEALFGDSPAVLPTLKSRLPGRTLFWLDAHWCGSDTFGSDDECPLLEEIAAVASLAAGRPDDELIVLIDDARLFLSPPPQPHKAEQWPELRTVLDACAGLSADPYMVVVDDVIVCVPGRARAYVQAYCQRVNTDAWREGLKAKRASLARRAAGQARKRLGQLRQLAEGELRKRYPGNER
jgi:hypothetical protein